MKDDIAGALEHLTL